ncbi:hypothetical protein HY357_01400, partial [Candidatus Roizmanbacteria bacterium]|nr:hypothetical protein [Candidatus Roizmanbacteria bacterium]
MARRRSLIKIPFFKFKINKQTIFNVFGFILIGIGLVFLISYLKNITGDSDGRILHRINNVLISRFGGLAIFLPFILILLSGHFFNTKKLNFVKPNMSGGLILLFISLLGIFQSGQFGDIIFRNLSLDFSLMGAIAILGVIFFVGLILFLDTSIDVFVIFLLNVAKSIFDFSKAYLFRSAGDKSLRGDKKDEKSQEFYKTETVADKKIEPVNIANKQLTIKPLSPISKTAWVYPPLSLLIDLAQKEADRGDVKKNADIIEKTLDSFGMRARVAEINYGPAVTQYALEITMGTKLSRITALGNDMALALAAPTGQVRI